ncbi:hypothetical protein HQ529_06530 [Candidatus Woesearchaeota archaeon]|nr:hypothetical protein [Candidatus Woesearchaeota archaeon]
MDRINELKKEINVKPVRICPKCGAYDLIFDTSNNRIYCTKCGFKEDVLK